MRLSSLKSSTPYLKHSAEFPTMRNLPSLERFYIISPPHCHPLRPGYPDFSLLSCWGSIVCRENGGPLHIPRVSWNYSQLKQVSGFTPSRKAQPNQPSDLQFPLRPVLHQTSTSVPSGPPQLRLTHHPPRASLYLSPNNHRFFRPITLDLHLPG